MSFLDICFKELSFKEVIELEPQDNLTQGEETFMVVLPGFWPEDV